MNKVIFADGAPFAIEVFSDDSVGVFLRDVAEGVAGALLSNKIPVSVDAKSAFLWQMVGLTSHGSADPRRKLTIRHKSSPRMVDGRVLEPMHQLTLRVFDQTCETMKRREVAPLSLEVSVTGSKLADLAEKAVSEADREARGMIQTLICTRFLNARYKAAELPQAVAA